ncbi:MAG TPA: hypothetical protein PL001_00060 [Candidatus Kryptobacter bacterium]|nr:hypothetical protein [Candidatus Kryptobacter bacterium]
MNIKPYQIILALFALTVYSVFITIKYLEKASAKPQTITVTKAVPYPVPDTIQIPTKPVLVYVDTGHTVIETGGMHEGLYGTHYSIMDNWLAVFDTTQYWIKDSTLYHTTYHSYSINSLLRVYGSMVDAGNRQYISKVDSTYPKALAPLTMLYMSYPQSPSTPAPAPPQSNSHFFQLWGKAGLAYPITPFIGLDIDLGNYGVGGALGFNYWSLAGKMRLF